MELDDLVMWIRSNLADVHVVVASKENGAPEGSWGDVLVMHEVPGRVPVRDDRHAGPAGLR